MTTGVGAWEKDGIRERKTRRGPFVLSVCLTWARLRPSSGACLQSSCPPVCLSVCLCLPLCVSQSLHQSSSCWFCLTQRQRSMSNHRAHATDTPLSLSVCLSECLSECLCESGGGRWGSCCSPVAAAAEQCVWGGGGGWEREGCWLILFLLKGQYTHSREETGSSVCL